MAASGSPRRLPQPSQQQRNGHDHDRHHHHLSGAEKTAVVDSLLAFDDEADSFLSKARRALESHGLRRPEITVAYKGVDVNTNADIGTSGISTVGNVPIKFTQDLIADCTGGHGAHRRPLKLLDGVSGVLKPGRLTLLLGPPACGKSTFLQVLGGHLKATHDTRITGSIRYNGQPLDSFHVQRTAAYVDQSDAHMAYYSVEETLQYAFECQAGLHGLDKNVSKDLHAVADLLKKATPDETGVGGDQGKTLEEVLATVAGTDAKVELMLRVFGLSHCRNTWVGDAMLRGISGGERKRLTTAEMLVGPRKVLLLDEISTGLDSATLFAIVRFFREATHGLRWTSLISLKQPPPETYQLFDDVLMFAAGRVIYHGPVTEVHDFIGSLGFRCPTRKDIPSFLLEVMTASGQHTYWTGSSDSDMSAAAVAIRGGADGGGGGAGGGRVRSDDSGDASTEDGGSGKDSGGKAASGGGGGDGVRAGSVPAHGTRPRAEMLVPLDEMARLFWTETAAGKLLAAEVEATSVDGAEDRDVRINALATKPFSLTLPEAIVVALRRQLKLMLRDRILLRGRIAQTVVLGLITGSLFYQLETTPQQGITFYGATFMAVLFIAFGGFPQLPFVLDMKKVWRKQCDSYFVPATAQGLAVALTQLPISLVECTVFSLIYFFMVGYYVSASSFFTFYIVIICTSLSLSSLFRLIGFLSRDAVIANTSAALSILILVITSGFVIVRGSIPPWIIWAYWLSPYAYSLRAIIINEFTSPKWQDVPTDVPGVSLGDAMLESFDFYKERFWIWVAVGYMLGVFVVCTLGSIASLKWQDAPAKRAQLPDDMQVAAAAAKASELRRALTQVRSLARGLDTFGDEAAAPGDDGGGGGAARGGVAGGGGVDIMQAAAAAASPEARARSTSGGGGVGGGGGGGMAAPSKNASQLLRAASRSAKSLNVGSGAATPTATDAAAVLRAATSKSAKKLTLDGGSGGTTPKTEAGALLRAATSKSAKKLHLHGAGGGGEDAPAATDIGTILRAATLNSRSTRNLNASAGGANNGGGHLLLGSSADGPIAGSKASVGGDGNGSSTMLPFHPITLVFKDLAYSVPNPAFSRGAAKAAEAAKASGEALDPSVASASNKTLRLLDGITGYIEPGVLTALMGGSGAGKSTLMDVIAGRKTVGTIEGSIYVNGRPKQQSSWSRVMGYCEQSDIHSPSATVLEALLFSARLRLGPEISDDRVLLFVYETLDVVGLMDIMYNQVGMPGESGLSVEQRKRLTIGVELVANPSVIFMDEPTSGLDACAANIVMRAVRNVADNGRTVCVTIHQPSIEIFEAFDTLLLIQRGGRVTYFGPIGEHSADLIGYLSSAPGVPELPAGYNPATWMLEVTGGSMATLVKAVNIDWPARFADSSLHAATAATADRLIKECEAEMPPLTVQSRFAQPFSTQFNVLLRKYTVAFWRSPSYNFVRLGTTLLAAIVYGVTYLQRGKIDNPSSLGNIQNIIGIMFSSSNLIGMTNLLSSMAVVGVERIIFYRERAAAMYDAFAYGFALAVVELPYLAAQTLLFVCIMYWLVGLKATAEAFFFCNIVFFETVAFYTIFGQFLVWVTPSAGVAQVIAATLNFLFNIFNGFVITYSQMPSGWRWLNRASPTTWILYGQASMQLGDSNNPVNVPGADINQLPTVSAYVESYFGYKFSFRWYCVLILAAYIAFVRVTSILALKYWNFLKR